MKNKISSLQAFVLTYFLILANAMGITSHLLLSSSKQNSCITIILGYLIGLVPLGMFLYIINNRSHENIFEKSKSIFGNVIGIIINTVLVLTVVYMTMICFWNLNDFISSQYLSKTPKIAISIIFLIPILYLVNKNILVLCRTTFVLFLISLIFLLLTFLGLFWQIDLNNLFPILNEGLSAPIKDGFSHVAFNAFAIILITMIPLDCISDKKNFNKRIFLSYSFANIVVMLVTFFVITILGINLANLYQYPEYHLLKKVSLIGFFERTESTLSLRWIFYLFIVTVTCLFYTKEYLRNTFNIKNVKINNIIISVISIIVIIGSDFLFPNNTAANHFFKDKLIVILYVILFLFPGSIAIKLWLDKRKNKNKKAIKTITY